MKNLLSLFLVVSMLVSNLHADIFLSQTFDATKAAPVKSDAVQVGGVQRWLGEPAMGLGLGAAAGFGLGIANVVRQGGSIESVVGIAGGTMYGALGGPLGAFTHGILRDKVGTFPSILISAAGTGLAWGGLIFWAESKKAAATRWSMAGWAGIPSALGALAGATAVELLRSSQEKK